MNKVFLIVTLFLIKSWCNSYGQQNPDLIVTSTGDSIQCHIINVDAGEIQFRLGAGNLVIIRQNEVASFEYNFYARSQGVAPPVSTTSTRKRDRSLFYLMISTGAADFGSVSFGDVGGFTVLGGADAAFFMTPWLKAGLKFSTINAKIDFGDKYTYSDRVMFIAPALYGSFGKNAFKVNACASAGLMNWQLSNQMRDGIHFDNKTSTSVGSLFSVGVSYRFTRHMGVGLNVHTIIGKVKNENENMERNPTGAGGTVGVFFSY